MAKAYKCDRCGILYEKKRFLRTQNYVWKEKYAIQHAYHQNFIYAWIFVMSVKWKLKVLFGQNIVKKREIMDENDTF